MVSARELNEIMAQDGPAVKHNTSVYNDGRYASIEAFAQYEVCKDEARSIKEAAIERLPELITELSETVESNGGQVYLADDAADATSYIRSIVENTEAKRVVKSKSMTTEEIELNEVLEHIDVEVIETDLAEWILQLSNDSPSHLVSPALHKSRPEIAALINDRFSLDPPLTTAEELTQFARNHLREQFKNADIGITGANFITADTGSILLVTSEGNARRTIAATDVHIAVAGVEKIVPTIEDLHPFSELIARSATGQSLPAYLSLITSPGNTPVVDFEDSDTPLSQCPTDREFHLVLLDNGRMQMREDDQLRETLYCIRCSACANSCANFQSVGGHAFGGETYTGGIATGWEAGIEGLDVASTFNDLCTGCSRCVNACPVRIDIPWINTVVRDRINRNEDAQLDWLVDGLTPDAEPGSIPLEKRFFGNFSTIARMGSLFAPVSNWVVNWRPSRYLLDRMIGVDARRALPAFRRHTFTDWAATTEPRIPEADHSVVVFPDVYTNYVLVERGIATVRALNALGVDVIVPDVLESGRAPLSQGMINTATRTAEHVYDQLSPYLEEDRSVVFIEPSDHAMAVREYERLLPEIEFQHLAHRSVEVIEYIQQLLEAGADPAVLQQGNGRRLAYHAHCQQRTLGLDDPTITVLEALGYDVLTSSVECCGMAGSFGYKSTYYEVSMAVGTELRQQFQTDDARDRLVVASGTSCQEQLDALLDRTARHPIEVIAPSSG